MLVCQLPAAFRRLPRPSSPVIAKASTSCTLSLDPITVNPLRHQSPRFGCHTPPPFAKETCRYNHQTQSIAFRPASPHPAETDRFTSSRFLKNSRVLADTTTDRLWALRFGGALGDAAAQAATRSRRIPEHHSPLLSKGGDPAAPSGTATLLRLHPSHESHRGSRPPCG